MSIKEKEEEKKKLTLLVWMVDAWPCGRVACGRGWWMRMMVGVDGGGYHVGVWTQMCCMQMWMSIKEKEEEKSLHCWCGWWTRGPADVFVWTRMVVDADGGGCGWMVVDTDGGGRGWWWTWMVVDADGDRQKWLTQRVHKT